MDLFKFKGKSEKGEKKGEKMKKSTRRKGTGDLSFSDDDDSTPTGSRAGPSTGANSGAGANPTSAAQQEGTGFKPAGFPSYLTMNNVYQMWTSIPKKQKPTIRDFAGQLIVGSNLEVKKYPFAKENVFGEIFSPLSKDEEQLRIQYDDCIERVNSGFRKFKKDYLDSTKRRKVQKGGSDANLVFIDILEEYPLLLKEEELLSQRSSQGTNSSTQSWLEMKIPKPRQKSKIRKMWNKLCKRYKRQKTDKIYRQILVTADELGVHHNALLGYLGFRANYLENKKVAFAFQALSEGKLVCDVSLDRALYMKFRYNFTKRDWIDFRLDFQKIMMPTDDELRAYMKTLLPDEDMIPFHKGWRIEIPNLAQKTLERLTEEVKFKLRFYFSNNVKLDNP